MCQYISIRVQFTGQAVLKIYDKADSIEKGNPMPTSPPPYSSHNAMLWLCIERNISTRPILPGSFFITSTSSLPATLSSLLESDPDKLDILSVMFRSKQAHRWITNFSY